MGGFFLKALLADDRWTVKYICDSYEPSRRKAAEAAPNAIVTDDIEDIYNDPEVDVVVLAALAEGRCERIEEAFARGKHVISEKPIADSLENERRAMKAAESSGRLSAVNLYLRNSWYHNMIKDFIASGEIGELAVVRLCHMTPGLSPGEGHDFEGPSFHDCGMHYVDITRFYAESEYKTMRAQAMRFWDWKDPWWLQAQGTFDNGVVFDITQSHTYGQLAKVQTHLSYADIHGTKGIVRMSHDFKYATVDMHGVSVTEQVRRPHGGKNIDVLLKNFAASIDAGRPVCLPSFRDAVVASEFAWKCLDDAWTHDMPSKGTAEELEEIHQRRWNMKEGEGYGLIRHK
jgi:myo-inositol 2-dehydrogenase/D-chiro-inositol 1-dehydrogenase